MEDYRKLAQKLINNFTADQDGILQLSSELCLDCKRAENAITELLDQNAKLKKQLQALAQKQMVYIELLLKLFKVSGMSIEEIIELFQAGHILQPSFEPISLTDFDEILQSERRAKSAETLAEKAKRTLALMWYAYKNKDVDCPHEYEKEAIQEAEKILGRWEDVMPCFTEWE